jgi:hypothetical protein
MGSPDRIQIDDHFAAAKRRSTAPPPRTIGGGRAAALLVLLAGAIAGTWWWALQPAGSSLLPTTPPLSTIADRQAAVSAGDADAPRGPRLGGETREQYQARMAANRAQAAATEAAQEAPATAPGSDTTDRAAAGRAAPVAALPGAVSGHRVAAPAAPSALSAPDRSAIGLAGRVNTTREDQAAHLRWLDACQKQRLVELARAQIARAKDGTTQQAALIAANNLAADIDTHQREARRIGALAATAEQRLVDYCAEHHQVVPPVENPPTTVDGRFAQPRELPPVSVGPALTIRPAAGAARQAPAVDPFGSR